MYGSRARIIHALIAVMSTVLVACGATEPPSEPSSEPTNELSSEVARRPVRTLANRLTLPYQIVLDHEYLYWVNSGTQLAPEGNVMRIAKRGGKATVIADHLDSPRGMVVDDTSVYWVDGGAAANTGALQRAPKSGGPPVELASGLLAPEQLLADDQFLYFADGVSIQRISKQGGAREVLFDTGFPFLSIATGIAIDDQHVYFEVLQTLETFAICSVAKTGGAITVLGTVNTLLPFVSFIAVDDLYVYWADDTDGTLRRAPKTGGASVVVADGLPMPTATGFLVPDSNRLYFAQQCGSWDIEDGARICAGPGGVFWVNRNGGAVHTVISGDTGFVGLALDRTTAYFTNQFNGVLQSIAR